MCKNDDVACGDSPMAMDLYGDLYIDKLPRSRSVRNIIRGILREQCSSRLGSNDGDSPLMF